jgi:glycosyltransferase involved in cell wall biosynthesis
MPPAAPKLSAIIITKNEAANIVGCLDALTFCDERIVVDCGSNDDTVRLAHEQGARVVHQDWLGFGAQKNFALSLAAGDWVLTVDADERVSPELAIAIRAAINAGHADGYELSRHSSFCGQPMRHSGWYPDYVLRVFRRGTARFSDHAVHERVVSTGKIARLEAPLHHTPVYKLEQALGRIDHYSSVGADELLKTGARVSFASGFVHGFAAFFKTYVLCAGFLDGRRGFLLAVANAEGTYYKYMKAWLAKNSPPPSANS